MLGITIFAFTGFNEIDGAKEVTFIGPALSATGLVFGLASFFVFAPNEELGCEETEDESGHVKCVVSPLRIIYALIAAFLFIIIFLIDTKMVIGGRNSMFVLGPECYIMGAI